MPEPFTEIHPVAPVNFVGDLPNKAMAHKNKAQKLRIRWNVSTWYPRVNDLQLPDVPPAERGQVRSILRWLGKLPIRGGTCWQTAQAIALLARDPRVEYVEGAYWNVKNGAGHVGPMFQHPDGTLECTSVCTCKPLPHGWNLVNGHVVDLLTEFHNWRFGGEWLHEPLKVYALADLRAFEKQHEDNPLLRVGGVLGGNFSICNEVWMEEHCAGLETIAPHLLSKPEAMPDEEYKAEISGVILKHVFKEAIDKLVQRAEAAGEAPSVCSGLIPKAA